MSAEGRSPAGSIARFDLTVPEAVAVRDFHEAVVGWRPEPVFQGGSDDFTMTAATGGPPVAGICHARGGIADLPPRWLAYPVGDDLGASIGTCLDRGGGVIAGPKGAGPGERLCLIRDPAGAVVALWEEPRAAASAAPAEEETSCPVSS